MSKNIDFKSIEGFADLTAGLMSADRDETEMRFQAGDYDSILGAIDAQVDETVHELPELNVTPFASDKEVEAAIERILSQKV